MFDPSEPIEVPGDAARYFVQMCTALLAAGMDRLYWYLLRDYHEFKGMGLLHAPDSELGRYASTPAYAAYANLIHQLGDTRFVRQEGDVRALVYLFMRHGQEVASRGAAISRRSCD